MTNQSKPQERCQYELWVEKYFGLDSNITTDRMEIKTDFGQLCNLLCTFLESPAKTAIPESLEECLLTDDEIKEIYASSDELIHSIDLTEKKMLEKFAAYLGNTAKDLMSNAELWKKGAEIVACVKNAVEMESKVLDKTQIAMLEEDWFDWLEELRELFSSRASEALREKDETIEKLQSSVELWKRTAEKHLSHMDAQTEIINNLNVEIKELIGGFLKWIDINKSELVADQDSYDAIETIRFSQFAPFFQRFLSEREGK